MRDSAEIIGEARQRAQLAGSIYAGSLMPQEAYALIQANSGVKLIDVRTDAELDWVGRVVIPGEQYVAVQWHFYPGREPNENFVAELERQVAKDDILLFLCRGGIRSAHAATLATESGFLNCFNIQDGFEGARNELGHRKSVNGWCYCGLPWEGA